MPIIKSAKKRVKLSAKANTRNSRTRKNLREAIKAFNKAIESGKPAQVNKTQITAYSAIDTAAKKAVVHKNKAARFKARLAAQAKAAGVKPAKAVSPEPKAKSQKPATKKPTAKKSPSKKTSAKKPTS